MVRHLLPRLMALLLDYRAVRYESAVHSGAILSLFTKWRPKHLQPEPIEHEGLPALALKSTNEFNA